MIKNGFERVEPSSNFVDQHYRITKNQPCQTREWTSSLEDPQQHQQPKWVAYVSQRVESNFLEYLVEDVDFLSQLWIPMSSGCPPPPIISRGLLSLLLVDSFGMWYGMHWHSTCSNPPHKYCPSKSHRLHNFLLYVQWCCHILRRSICGTI